MSGTSGPEAPSVTVVVSAYNEAPGISACIDSLMAQRLVPESIVVVDDGSTDPTADVLRRYHGNPRIDVVILPRNQGVPGARNVGAARSRSDMTAFIDADAHAPADWLAELLVPFSDPAVVAAGGPDRAPENDTAFALAVDHTIRSWIGTGRLRLKNPFAPYSPAGCNLAIRTAAFAEVGGFDERLNRRGEEKELISRLRRHGRIAYCDRALVWHHRRVSPRQFWRQMYLSGRARVDILRLAPEALAWPHLAPAALVLAVLSALGWIAAKGLDLLCLGVIVAYLLLLAVNGVIAGYVARSPRIAVLVPLTTAIVHWGYGIGLLNGGLRWLARSPVGEPSPAAGASVPKE